MASIPSVVTQITEDLYKGGEEIPSHALLGKSAFRQMMSEMASTARYNGYSDTNPRYIQDVQIMMSHGSMWIKQSAEVPADHVSVGGRTLLDVIAESILLGDE